MKSSVGNSLINNKQDGPSLIKNFSDKLFYLLSVLAIPIQPDADTRFQIDYTYDSSSTIKIILEDLSTSCAMMAWVVLGTHFPWEVSQT